MTVVLFGAIGYVAAHAGAAVNAYIPVYAWTSIIFGVALDRLLTHLERSCDDSRAALATTVVLAAAAVQLTMFIYNPGRYLPPLAVREARQRFLDQVRSVPGDVYIFSHSYDAVLAGKQPHAESESIGAVFYAPANDIAPKLHKEFDEALLSHRYTAIFVDGSIASNQDHFLDYGFLKSYPYALSAVSEPDRFLTSQPTWILIPCSSASQITAVAAVSETSIRLNQCVPSLSDPGRRHLKLQLRVRFVCIRRGGCAGFGGGCVGIGAGRHRWEFVAGGSACRRGRGVMASWRVPEGTFQRAASRCGLRGR